MPINRAGVLFAVRVGWLLPAVPLIPVKVKASLTFEGAQGGRRDKNGSSSRRCLSVGFVPPSLLPAVGVEADDSHQESSSMLFFVTGVGL